MTLTRQVLTTQVPTSLELTSWTRLLRTHAALTRAFNSQLEAEHGLALNEWEALLLLSRAPDRRLKRVELVSQLLLTPSGITRLLERLEAVLWVEKASCPTDARVTYAVLTEAGQAKLREAADTHLAAIHALFSECFAPEELETLGSLLARLPGGAGDDSSCSPG